MTETETLLVQQIRAAFGPSVPERIGIALSGGGDSMAMMHLLVRAFPDDPSRFLAATVDHGLRSGSDNEAGQAGQAAGALGIGHDVLRWQGWDRQGNLQAEARAARYRLLTEWAAQKDIPVLALGHTMDDQAETVLMRLARSAGVDGLSGIPERRIENGIVLLRPMLRITRGALRDFLIQLGVEWSEDPSNDNPKFDRIRMRRAMGELAGLGLSVAALADVAFNQRKVREALDWYTFMAARDFATVDDGAVDFDLRRLRTLPDEIGRRLLARAFCWVSGNAYPPRRAPLLAAFAAARAGEATTLHGCILKCQGQHVHICREYNAVASTRCRANELWDGVWRLKPTAKAEVLCDKAEIRALGPDGLAQCPDWRETGRSWECLLASPSVWIGEELVAAPFAGSENGWRAERAVGPEEFFEAILSH